MTKDHLLIEVLPVTSIVNGSAVTIVSLDQLQNKHRRHKRDISKKKIRFSPRLETETKLTVSEYESRKRTYTTV